MVVILLGGLVLWGSQTTISGAVLVPGGIITADGATSIQHPDGGQVEAVLVKAGEEVIAGQPLLELDSSLHDIELELAQTQLESEQIKEARLQAERNGSANLTIAVTESQPAPNPVTIQEEIALFESRQTSLDQQIAPLEAQRTLLLRQVQTLASEEETAEAALTEKDAEMAAVESSGESQVSISYQLSALQQQRSAIATELFQIQQSSVDTEASLASLSSQIGSISSTFQSSVLEELSVVHASIAQKTAQVESLNAQIESLVVRAPVAGTAHFLTEINPGSVLGPGAEALQVIPGAGGLVAQVQVPPTEVERIELGSQTQLRFSGLNANLTPEVSGYVESVSPDVVVDSESGESYYSVRIRVDEAEWAKIGNSHHLLPGMPLEAVIETGDRTVLSYLVKPITDQFSRAFREE